MKKIFTRFLIFCMTMILAATTLVACDNSKSNVIRLSEVTHSVFYAPLYVAIERGFFLEEGIEIELTNGGGANNVMTSLITNAADIGLMGPEATVYVNAQNTDNNPIIFGQLTNCDGAFLIGREAQPNFKWTDLRGKHIIAGRKAGMPAMTLQYIINKAGVDLSELNFDTSIEFNLMAAAFEGNSQYDYVTLFEPTASAFVQEGKGHMITSIGKDSGAVPYTTFSATKKFLDKNPDTIKGFLRAIIKGYKYIADNDAEVVAAALKPAFSTTSDEMLVATINSYLAIDAWKSTPIMNEKDFLLLQDIMINAGELDKAVEFTKMVDNSFAQSVLDEMG